MPEAHPGNVSPRLVSSTPAVPHGLGELFVRACAAHKKSVCHRRMIDDRQPTGPIGGAVAVNVSAFSCRTSPSAVIGTHESTRLPSRPITATRATMLIQERLPE